MNPETEQNYTINIVTFSMVRETEQTGLGTPEAVYQLVRQLIPNDAKEHFGALMLNTQNRLVAYHEISMGTLSASLVHPREVFGPALRIMGIASIILVHNHPSGDPAPSREDRELTHRLVEAGKILGIGVLDHVVIGNGTERWVSLLHIGELR